MEFTNFHFVVTSRRRSCLTPYVIYRFIHLRMGEEMDTGGERWTKMVDDENSIWLKSGRWKRGKPTMVTNVKETGESLSFLSCKTFHYVGLSDTTLLNWFRWLIFPRTSVDEVGGPVLIYRGFRFVWAISREHVDEKTPVKKEYRLVL